MKISNIQIQIKLDDNDIPEEIQWQATDGPDQQAQLAKAFALSIWDNSGEGTLKIDLWNKQMDVLEMKRFVIETISGLADTIRRATADELMAMDMENLSKSLGIRLDQEVKMVDPQKGK